MCEYDSVSRFRVGFYWGSILGEHSLATSLPARNMGQCCRRNELVYAEEPHFGPDLTRSCTHRLGERFEEEIL